MTGTFEFLIYLVIAQAEVPDESIILQDIRSQLLYPGLVFEVTVAFQESFVKLNNLA
jgi:hypothetical protein